MNFFSWLFGAQKSTKSKLKPVTDSGSFHSTTSDSFTPFLPENDSNYSIPIDTTVGNYDNHGSGCHEPAYHHSNHHTGQDCTSFTDSTSFDSGSSTDSSSTWTSD
ncbi:hypothetical protein [Foetidibacter luteolus]|uniref:hypothetical protein n=1 Tax=Foetidibacter luteolus TaxID=2608880 RepID=UPI00129AE7E8|nr:hypothetical protein [Foetidibacter luteolus]